jgi:hypothetical protein
VLRRLSFHERGSWEDLWRILVVSRRERALRRVEGLRDRFVPRTLRAQGGEVRNSRHGVIEEVGWRRWRFHLSFKVRPIVVVIRTLSAFSGWCVAEKQAAPPRPKVFPAASPSSHFCFPAFPAFNFRVSCLQISAIPHLTIQDQHLAIQSFSLSDTFVV